MNTKNVILATAIAAVFLVAAVGSASALCDQTVNPDCHGCCYIDSGTGHTMCYECGDTVATSCTFDNPMTCPGGGSGNPQHGLIIGANDIVINGDNYTLTGGEWLHWCRRVQSPERRLWNYREQLQQRYDREESRNRGYADHNKAR